MRKGILAALAFALVIAGSALASADGRGPVHGGTYRGHHYRHWHSGPRVFLGFGAPYYYGWRRHYGWGPAGYGWWWPPPPIYVEERTIVREPPVYVEREPGADSPDGYWYFCRSQNAYYPDVEHCPEPWVPVPPRSQ